MPVSKLAVDLFTCCGKGDEVPCDELLEFLVFIRERFAQRDLQPSEESQSVQTVEGETAGERQQVTGRVDRSGRHICHQVAIHRTAEGVWGQKRK